MTRITRISLHGFKSFAHKTNVPFDTKYNCVLGPNGSGKCVTGDALVQLATGDLVPIKKLVEQQEKKGKRSIVDDGVIFEGDGTEILCLNTQTYELERKPIEKYTKRSAPEKLIYIKTRSGRHITATPYHPLFILKEGKILSARADELEEGKKIAVPREISTEPKTKIFFELLDEITSEDGLYVPWSPQLEHALKEKKRGTWSQLAKTLGIPSFVFHSFFCKQAVNFSYLIKILRELGYVDAEIISIIPRVKAKVGAKTYPVPWKNTPDLARLLGYLLAEGRITATNQIWFTNGTPEIVEDYVSLMQQVFSERASVNEYKQNAWDVIVYSRPLQAIFTKFGMPRRGGRTEEKTVAPFYLSHSSNHELAELINGLYCGDGYVSKTSIELTTKSKKLAQAVQIILTRLGILYQSREVVKIATNSGFSGRYTTILVYGQENFAQFARNISFVHLKKQERLLQLSGKIGNTNLDLIDVNALIKEVTSDCGINVKQIKKRYAKIDAYCYQQCTPSRQGVQQLVKEVFLPSGTQSQALLQLQNLAYAPVYWDEIQEITEVQPSEPWVYDLCVAEHHNFIANNIFVHNSNIGDALCFVLGRLSAKSLRAEKTSHLIFNGAKSKKPSSAATVEIAFDNTKKIFPEDAPEVVVSRTVTTKGTSVYRVNGKKRSRTEVLDLLAIAKINPDGYNIILQGDIMRFVDMPTVERRKILEEISDVSVYEEKKEKALREMEHVDEKLQNASVILKERRMYLKELEKDRNQALQFKEAKANIDACKATIIHLQQQEKEAARETLEKEMGGRQTAIANFEKESTALKEKITKAKEAVSQLNKEIEQKGEKEQLRVHREVEELKVRMAQDKTRVSSLKDELNKIEQRKDQLQKELQDLQEKASSLSSKEKDLLREKQQKEREAAELEKHLAQFRKKHNLESSQELERSIDEKESRLDALQESVQKTRLQQQDLLREKDKLEYQLQTLDERLQKVKIVEKEQQEQVKALQQLKKELAHATLRLNSCLEQDSSFAAQMAHAKTKLQGLQEQQAAIEAKLRSVDADMHANPAVKRLLEQKKRFSGMEGTIAQLGRVDKKYARAVETAAGGKMQHLVVDTDKTAAQCIEFLKKEKLGVVSFIPLNKIKYVDITADDKSLLKQQGAHDFALHLVTFPAAYKKAFAHVFGNTLVVDDVEAARKIGVGRIRMSTLEGDSVMESGVMRGGFLQRSGGGFKERDSEELLEKLENESSQLQSVIDSVRTKREANEQEIAALRNKRSELEAEMVKFEKLLHLETGDLEATEQSRGVAQQRLKDVEKLLGEMQKGLSQQNGELLQLKEEKQQLRLKVTELRDPRLLAQLRAFEESRQQCREALLRIEAELKNAHVHGEQLVAPEQEKVLGILKQHDKEELQFRKEVEQLTASLAKQEKVLAEKEKASTQFYAQYRELFTKREKLSQEISSFENKVEQLREKARSQEKELNLVSLKNAEVKARLAGLDEELKRHAGVKLLPEKNVEKLQKDLGRFEIVLSQMSAVNLKALEIYEQIETEFNALVKKKEDLEKEKTDVLALMNEIESKKTEHFLKTFNQANENFQRIFSSLFTKGKAYLQLENQKDIFADGLSIKVRLSGNRFLDIKSLSGGEKTLTALAFIFAIQEYQPASFYVLDEIDAALDKHNSEKLAKLIRNYADRAQYILISHNDALISEADTLFGVSMQDGVSKVTSLKV